MLKLLFFIAIAFAHDGHEASQVAAPKGGIIRSLESVHIELLSKGKTVYIYPYDLQMKPEMAKKFPVSATVTLPRKSAQALPLIDKGESWEAQFDAKGAHRYTVEFSIKQAGHDDKLKFTVEPKK